MAKLLKKNILKTYSKSQALSLSPAKYPYVNINLIPGKVLVWNKNLPTKYLIVKGSYKTSFGKNILNLKTINKIAIVNKVIHGSLVVLEEQQVIMKKFPALFDYSKYLAAGDIKFHNISENQIIQAYTKLYLRALKTAFATRVIKRPSSIRVNVKNKNFETEKRGYLKHLVRLRYRWFFKPKLFKFKLFKKFFKRTLKRFRKIKKNRLFVEKFRTHFSRITGFKERALFKMWLPFRRNYNQYWSTTNAVTRFAQSLTLTPTSFLVLLGISPSFAASKYLVKSGAISVNGLPATRFTVFKPGDIMHINIGVWNAVRSFFSYQKWHANFINLQHIPFLYIDWSSMLVFMLRWPRKYELIAPSFLSERWVRYYVRLFPVKTGKFRKAKNNLRIYKKIINKQ